MHDLKTDGPAAERSRLRQKDVHKNSGWQKRRDLGEDGGRRGHGSRRRGNLKIVVDPDRMAAYKALVRIEKSKAYSNIELNMMLEIRDKAESSVKLNRGRDSAGDDIVNPGFVRELVYGVVRNRRYLDYFIDSLARDGIESVRKEVVVLLETGIYQIVFMDSVPDHSAVDETVKIAKLLFPGRDGFINGLLRNFVRSYYVNAFENDSECSEAGDEGSGEADGQKGKAEEGKEVARRVPVPDIADDIERMSVMYSCDEGLVRLIAGQYGVGGAEEILSVLLETPPLFVRVNTIKTSSDDLTSSLVSQGFKAEPYEADPSGCACSGADNKETVSDILIVSGRGILESKEFRDGLFFVQDASSAMAIKELGLKAGETLIDVCAAPGGKSFAAAVEMQDQGVIHAMDLHGNKLKALIKEAKRLGITIIDTEEHDAKTVLPKYAGTADKVLCDVPCSGVGVLRRKPEIKDRPLVNDGKDLAGIQYKILEASSDYVKQGGELMYSTCTINKIENEEVTDRFLSEHEDFTVRCSRHIMPCSGGPDGFYYCIMRRSKR